MNDAIAKPDDGSEQWWNQFRAVVGTRLVDGETLATLGARWLDATSRFGLTTAHLRLVVLKVTHPATLARIGGSWDVLREWSAATELVVEKAKADRENAALKALHGQPRVALPEGVVSLLEVFTRGRSEAQEEAQPEAQGPGKAKGRAQAQAKPKEAGGAKAQG